MTASHSHAPSLITSLHLIAPLAAITTMMSGCALADAGIGAIRGDSQEDMTVVLDDMGMVIVTEDMTPEPECSETVSCKEDRTCVELSKDGGPSIATCIDILELPTEVSYKVGASDSFVTLDNSTTPATLRFVEFPSDTRMTPKFRTHHIGVGRDAPQLVASMHDFPGAQITSDVLITSLDARDGVLRLGMKQEIDTAEEDPFSFVSFYSFRPDQQDIDNRANASYNTALEDEGMAMDYPQNSFTVSEDTIPVSGLISWRGTPTMFASSYFCNDAASTSGKCTHAALFLSNDAGQLATELLADDGFEKADKNVRILDFKKQDERVATLSLTEGSASSLFAYYYSEMDDEAALSSHDFLSAGIQDGCDTKDAYYTNDEERVAKILYSQPIVNESSKISFVGLVGENDVPSKLMFYRNTMSPAGASCKTFQGASFLRLLQASLLDGSTDESKFRAVLAGKGANNLFDTLIFFDADAPLAIASDNDSNKTTSVKLSLPGQDRFELLEAFPLGDDSSTDYVVLAQGDNGLITFKVDASGNFMPLE